MTHKPTEPANPAPSSHIATQQGVGSPDSPFGRGNESNPTLPESQGEDLVMTGAPTVAFTPDDEPRKAANSGVKSRVVSIVHTASNDQTMANAASPDFEGVGDAPVQIGDATMDAIGIDLPTRREGANTREQLDEKIRAHLDRATAERLDPLLGQVVGGRFLVLKKIGSGGMGSVYRARQEGMDRDVAIKVLLGDLKSNETVLRRFTLEALAVSRLRHPNTIQIFDYGQTPDGNPYIAMELLEGLTLYDLLRKERPLPIRRALRVMGQVAQSLAEAHSKEIVHRDLKPENIFLVQVGDNVDYVKVLDFGVAKLRDHKNDAGTLTQAGSIFGTPRYMSPEQCSAQPVDARSDLYALGVILYEMITGNAPFTGDQALQLLLAHVNETPVPPSQATDKQVIPAEVEELVLQLLEKKPDFRVQVAGDLARRCQDLADQLPTAFDQRIGSAQEAESLGVRVSSATTGAIVTARTMRNVSDGAQTADISAVPELVMLAPPASKLPLVLGGAAAVAAAVFAMWVATRPPEVVVKTEVIKEQIAVPVAALADDKLVRITVKSNPPGAQILKDDKLLGTTNATLDLAKGAPDETWQLLRDGYEPQTLTVSFAAAQLLSIELKKLTPTVAHDPAKVARPLDRSSGKGDTGKKEAGKAEPTMAAKPEPKVEAPKERTKPEVPKPPPKKDDKIEDPDLQ
ncbi:MAG: serine/threonine protein kinase [Myxococcales bacterium]|nr:serine/threonine protein kinase [Myxococcales bacterium]